ISKTRIHGVNMKSLVQTVKGTRDFYPEEMAVRSWLYQTIRGVSGAYGYEEYEGPILEKIDLYAAKSGEELVKEQAFVFQDRGGDCITLRPELTPSLARMVAQRQRELAFPLRWWSFGPFWRYERPQKGRTREFFQWNIDMIGVNSPEADAELVSICVAFFRAVGLSPQQVKILVNNRRLMDAELGGLGIAAELRPRVFHLIDRRDKLSPEAWEAYALESGLSQAQLDALKALLVNPDLWQRSDELVRFFDALEAYDARDYVHFDPQIVRGLDYYTGIIFEGRDAARDGRAILGGGHYDNLVSDVGGDPLPGVGFAMGDVMIGLVLQKYGCLPQLRAMDDAVLVTVFDESMQTSSARLAAQLRRAGLKVIAYPEPAKLSKQLKFADRKGVRMVVICGPDEQAAGQVTLKDLARRTQETLAQEDAASRLQQWLAEPPSV
ncbi:MAG: histidine--tRNA ligase, partial [Anaerolineaceae bacterium]|nr:histidine--tRNA ligase [Anaerolineaceae bacterium]